MTLRLACDATAIKYPLTGVQQAVLQQLDALLTSLGKTIEAEVFAPIQPPAGLCTHTLHDTHLISQHPLRRILWQQLRLPALLQQANAEWLYAFAYTAPWHCPIPYILNVHDLIALTHPELCSFRNRWQMRALLPHSIRHATMNVASTGHGADELKRLLDIPSQRIEVIPLGVDWDFFSTPAKPHPDLPPERPYLLFVSTIEPKKDVDTLLDAYATVADDLHLNLVIVGQAGWNSSATCKRLQHWQSPGRVIWLHYVPREQLPGLYQHAKALIVPSLVEGFGLPVLEAMAAGTPVIHSNHPALMEAAGQAGLPFPRHDSQALARTIVKLCQAQQLQQACKEAGKKYAVTRTWDLWGIRTAQLVNSIMQP